MKIESIQKALDEIRARARHDPEAAHGMEDHLHHTVLENIASGKLFGHAAQNAAKLAMSSREIKFSRWCA